MPESPHNSTLAHSDSRQTCVILQPSYIPWRGYFDQIRRADFFVFYDDVQYDKHGWRNRNLIKNQQGLQWLSIPVASKGAVSGQRLINQIPMIWDKDWSKLHWRTLQNNYARAPYFHNYRDLLAEIYGRRDELLADFTITTTIRIAQELGITRTQFFRSSELQIAGSRTERLLKIVRHFGAKHYISGPSARDYLDESLFDQAGITLEYMQYNYPAYPQLYPPFQPQVSILDLLFQLGPQASAAIHSLDSQNTVAHAA